jgi:hypothetical protein
LLLSEEIHLVDVCLIKECTGNEWEGRDMSRPLRDPDHFSKRGVPYWWAPDWLRGTSSEPSSSYGHIKAIKEKDGTVSLYMKSKEGNHTYIQGSIQHEFRRWHEDRSIDYILLGENPDSIIE